MKEKVEDMTKSEGGREGGRGGLERQKRSVCTVHVMYMTRKQMDITSLSRKKKWKRSQDVSVGIMQKGNVFCKWIENSQTPELPKVKFSTLRMTRRWLSL